MVVEPDDVVDGPAARGRVLADALERDRAEPAVEVGDGPGLAAAASGSRCGGGHGGVLATRDRWTEGLNVILSRPSRPANRRRDPAGGCQSRPSCGSLGADSRSSGRRARRPGGAPARGSPPLSRLREGIDRCARSEPCPRASTPRSSPTISCLSASRPGRRAARGLGRLDLQRGPCPAGRATSSRATSASPTTRAIARRPRPPRRSAASEKELDKKFRKNYRDVSDLWGYPGFRRRPLTTLLIVACVVVFILQNLPPGRGEGSRRAGTWTNRLLFTTFTEDAQGRLHDNGLDDIEHGEVWRLVTPIFMHVESAAHLLQHVVAPAAGHADRGPPGDAPAGRPGPDLGGRLQLRPVSCGWNGWDDVAPFLGMSGVVYALFGYIWMKGLYEPEQGMTVHPNNVNIMLALARPLHDRRARRRSPTRPTSSGWPWGSSSG